ncbi:MAG: putative RecB family nuclease [Marivirga sp.]|jgi:predicted RecB family nuclease
MLILRMTLIASVALVFQSCIVSKKEPVNLEGMWRFSNEKILNGVALSEGTLVENQHLFIIDSVHFNDQQYMLYGVNGFVEQGEYHLNYEQQLHLTNREGTTATDSSEVLEDLFIDLLTLKSKKISFSLPMNIKYPDSKEYRIELEGIFKK